MLENIPRLNLGGFPTPLHRLDRYGQHIGHSQFYMKRDDISILGTGGNKLRNLEYQLAEAMAQGADIVLVAGGLQSNQCRLTAAASCKLGLECVIVHNDHKPSSLEGNALLNHLMGVQRIYLGRVDEVERGARLRDLANSLFAAGRRPYIVEQNARGSLGYASAALELHRQSTDMGLNIRHVAIVGAMGGTAAGFLYGAALLGKPFHVHVISVEYDLAYLQGTMEDLWQQMSSITGSRPRLTIDQVSTLYDDYLGEGYAVPTAESLQAVRDLARTEGVFMETVYNAKTLYGVSDLIRRGVIPQNEAVCVFNTGGSAALFAQGTQFQ